MEDVKRNTLEERLQREYSLIAAAKSLSHDSLLRIIVMGVNAIEEQIKLLDKARDKQGSLLSAEWVATNIEEKMALNSVHSELIERRREIESGQERMFEVDAT